jgi:hypothetical protein
MKELRKTEDGLFICEECGKHYVLLHNMCVHIKTAHMEQKLYYDKWLNEDDNICKICGGENEFMSIGKGYKPACTNNCAKELRLIKTRKTKLEKYGNEKYTNWEKCKQTKLEKYGDENYNNSDKNKVTCQEKYGNPTYNNMEKAKTTIFERYGVTHHLQIPEIRNKSNEKIRNTNLQKYGVSCALQAEPVIQKIKKTKLEKYGDENYCNPEKTKLTKQERYGDDYIKIIDEKRKQTMLERYGVEYPAQNIEFFKNSKNFKLLEYKNTKVFYQCSYEYDFLKKYYDKFKDIYKGLAIIYYRDNKCHFYYPDFHIPSLNLIIEIKSDWYYDEYLDNIKKEATINSGFNYIMILNKNYSEFEELISKLSF